MNLSSLPFPLVRQIVRAARYLVAVDFRADCTCWHLTGPYNCVGKQLALMEIRNVTSRILRRYDVALAPGQTKDAFVAGLVDSFTLTCPRLDLVFTPRD